MDTPHRQRILGDTDNEELNKVEFEKQSPKHWLWGRNDQAARMHLLLMVYAHDDDLLNKSYGDLESEWLQAGLKVIQDFDPQHLPGRKEHFGFRDGTGQPDIEGVEKEESAAEAASKTSTNMIKPGEILLGYPNEYGTLPPSPTVADPLGGQPFDFGRNGSYLVFRQLQQDVPGFWNYIAKAAHRANQTLPEHLEACVKLAAKMVGRWPRGAPLATNPVAEPPPGDRRETDPTSGDLDKFLYGEDPLGLNTPIGSHIRRSNPRDSLEPGPDGKERLSADDSLHVTRLHRIVRRGRPYGPPLVPSMDPNDILQRVASMNPSEMRHAHADPHDPGRGLLFLCFNANIARQFEFIQQTWINNPKFVGLYQDSDPLMGHRHPGELNEPADIFTVQATPVRQRYTGLNQFVRVRGGGYFFMPSIEAVKYLAHLPCPHESVPPGEEKFTAKLTALLMDKVVRDYPTGTTRRDAHAKHHGCVHAEFQVERDLRPELRVGIFSEPRVYKAWIRFSNQDGVPQPDIKSDIRGMAIKLLGVAGDKLLEDERDAQTQDFLLISTNRFVTKDVKEFHDLIAATIKGTWHLVWFLINPFDSHFRVLRNLWTSLRRYPNPLEIRYFSTTPYLFGARAVKYSARPTGACSSQIPPSPSRDYLREAMKESLQKGEVHFDFLIQFQADPYNTPIEDPGQEWSETISPFHKVATIRIPSQSFDSEEQMAFGENLSFTPWHSLPIHRPLGGINRARKVAYQAVSVVRHQRNQVLRKEPGEESVPFCEKGE
jgi:Dyp-type peroxidase family